RVIDRFSFNTPCFSNSSTVPASGSALNLPSGRLMARAENLTPARVAVPTPNDLISTPSSARPVLVKSLNRPGRRTTKSPSVGFAVPQPDSSGSPALTRCITFLSLSPPSEEAPVAPVGRGNSLVSGAAGAGGDGERSNAVTTTANNRADPTANSNEPLL